MTRAPSPPRLPAWLFLRLGGRRADYMLAELNEEFVRYVLPQRGRWRAAIWFWLQIARSLPSVLRAPHGRRGSLGRRPGVGALVRELRFAVRGLRRAPRFSITVVLMLGLGVGAGMSVFALVDLLLLRPPPHVEDPERVRRLVLRENRPPIGEFTSTSLAWIDYEAMRDHANTLDGVAAWFTIDRSLGRGAGARNITVMMATPSLFPVLGVRPARGRFFDAHENAPGMNPAPCVASHRFWQRDLRGDDAALGTEILVGSLACVIVGVAPAGFNGVELDAVELWMPIRTGAADFFGPGGGDIWTTDRSHWVRVLARLRAEVSEEVAGQDATSAYRTITTRGRDPELRAVADWQSIRPGRQSRRATVDISLLLLAGGAGLLLLISANLANLFVVREIGRTRETAIHIALGGSPLHLVITRGLEAAVLAVGAGAIGLGVATWFGPIVRTTLVTGVDFAGTAMNARIVLTTMGIALLLGLLIAAASALRVRAIQPGALLASAGSARSGGTRRMTIMRLSFVSVQAGLSAALLLASIAFVRSFRQAANVDLGFDRHDVMVATVPLRDVNYTLPEEWRFYRELHARAIELPAVASASLGHTTPWWNSRSEGVSIPGRDSLPPVPGFGAPAFDAVTPDYLTTLGLTMRAGRWLHDNDLAGAAAVVVINEALRDLYWPQSDPIGQCMRIGDGANTPCREVVGVVANHRINGGLDDPAIAGYFLPLSQTAEYAFEPRLFVRSSGPVEDIFGPVRQIIQTTATNLPAPILFRLEDTFEPLISPWRLGSYAFTVLGGLALMVGTLGLFSILSYVVAERRREFAIRAAIGATSRQIAVPVLRQAMTTVAAGVAGGVGLAMATSGWLESLLFRTRITDPGALLLAAGISLSVAVLASASPARNAAAKSPMDTLRTE